MKPKIEPIKFKNHLYVMNLLCKIDFALVYVQIYKSLSLYKTIYLFLISLCFSKYWGKEWMMIIMCEVK